MRFLLCISVGVLFAQAQVSVLTYHNDLARTGQNLAETALTKAAVAGSGFGRLFSQPVDGYVYAQPLYMPGVMIPGKGPHNVVYVATEHDSVYAFDADSASGPNAQPLWHASFINPSAGVTTVPYGNVNCNQIVPEIGITGTPVIDPNSGTLYVVAMTLENGAYVHRLHALDITTGAERAGSPVEIAATVSGTGEGGTTITLQAKSYKQRPGLLLLNGTVYAGMSSHCDIGTYHGWLIGYDAKTLRQTTVYNDTPDGNQASLWASGAAPAADSSGHIFLMSGNGDFDAASGGPDLGDSFIRLSSAGGLSVGDSFTPFNVQSLNDQDLDIGSSGPLLLPDSAGSAAHPHLLVSAGKEGRIYLVDRDHMGGYQAGADSQIPQSLAGTIGGLFGIPAYFNNTVYFSASGDYLKAFTIQNARLSPSPVSQSPEAFSYPGSTPVVSSNGASDGIVWAAEGSGGGTLHAFDAGNLSTELFSGSLGSYVKFSSPTIANGKVYVGTQNSIVVFALAPLAGSIQVKNAASLGAGVVAPGSTVSILGNFGVGSTLAGRSGLPTWLESVTVHIGGLLAPLYFVSAGQIDAQVPFEVAPGSAAVVVSVGGADIATGSVSVEASAPGLFPVVLDQDQSVNSTANPAAVGSTVTAYITGQGAVQPAVETGAIAPSQPLAGIPLSSVSATVGGKPAEVVSAELTPGEVGLFQVSLKVPGVSGSQPLVVGVNGNLGNSVMIGVK